MDGMDFMDRMDIDYLLTDAAACCPFSPFSPFCPYCPLKGSAAAPAKDFLYYKYRNR